MNSTVEKVAWEKLHQQACEKQELTYVDPQSGLTVSTRLKHIARGYCCGSGCRHCPYEKRHTKGATKIAL